MTPSLPLRANLEWLKKLCKERLAALRSADPAAQLADAQLEVARELGFASWAKLKAYVELVRQELGKLAQADAGAPLAAPDDADLAQLFSAIEAGETHVVLGLLERRPILAQSRGRDGRTPLHLAARYDDPTLCTWLVAYGADLEARFGESGHTPLSWAATCNAPACAKALVRLGAKPDLYSVAGAGLLDAVRACFDESGNLLAGACRAGSSLFAADGSRLPCPPALPREKISDALTVSARNGQAAVVEFLLTKHPDLSFRGFMGGTALHWAHFGGSAVVIAMLEAAGADAGALDDVLGCPPRAFGITVAASWGLDFAVTRLLDADPRLANPRDVPTTPLHEAARGGHATSVQILLDRGADAQVRNSAGQTPRDVALERGRLDVARLLGGDA